MISEKRNKPRVATHIVLEMVASGDPKHYYGYIENISESGMCIVSLEPLLPGTKVTSGFYLSDDADKLNPTAALVNMRIGPDTLYYHGFRFESVAEGDRESLAKFMQHHLNEGGLERSSPAMA